MKYLCESIRFPKYIYLRSLAGCIGSGNRSMLLRFNQNWLTDLQLGKFSRFRPCSLVD